MFGFDIPKYAHISPLAKIDEETGGVRKLSKRKDPEAAVSYYEEEGIPEEAVKEYLLNIANSNFENWRKSPFLKFGYSIKRGFKHIALWGVALLYKMKLPMIYINTYRFLVDKLKIDIKF